MRATRQTVFALLLFLLVLACSEKNEPDLRKLARIYVDLEIAKESAPTTDSLKILSENVFAKYSVDEKTYDSLLSAIPPQQETWQKFFDYAKKYVDSLKLAELNKEKHSTKKD